MMSTNPKQALYSEFAAVARAFGSPRRLEILEQLAQAERGVDALATRVGQSVANVSQHLQLLKRAGLVTSRRDGKFVRYRLMNGAVLDTLSALFKIAESNLVEVERIRRRYFSDRDGMEPVSRDELLRRTREGLVTVLDVRPSDEFEAAHLPGAVSIPLDNLEKRLAELNPEQEIVAYCRGPWCVMSFEAVALLRARGFRVRRLEEGLPQWKAAGLPVEGAGTKD